MDLKNIKKFIRQEAETEMDSLELDSGRPSSIASGDKTVTVDGSIKDEFDSEDLEEEEDFPKKKFVDVSDSKDVSLQLNLGEYGESFDQKEDSHYNVTLDQVGCQYSDTSSVKKSQEDISQPPRPSSSLNVKRGSIELEKNESSPSSSDSFEDNSKLKDSFTPEKDKNTLSGDLIDKKIINSGPSSEISTTGENDSDSGKPNSMQGISDTSGPGSVKPEFEDEDKKQDAKDDTLSRDLSDFDKMNFFEDQNDLSQVISAEATYFSNEESCKEVQEEKHSVEPEMKPCEESSVMLETVESSSKSVNLKEVVGENESEDLSRPNSGEQKVMEVTKIPIPKVLIETESSFLDPQFEDSESSMEKIIFVEEKAASLASKDDLEEANVGNALIEKSKSEVCPEINTTQHFGKEADEGKVSEKTNYENPLEGNLKSREQESDGPSLGADCGVLIVVKSPTINSNTDYKEEADQSDSSRPNSGKQLGDEMKSQDAFLNNANIGQMIEGTISEKADDSKMEQENIFEKTESDCSVPSFDEDEIGKKDVIKQLFRLLDKSNSGYISPESFGYLIRSLGGFIFLTYSLVFVL